MARMLGSTHTHHVLAFLAYATWLSVAPGVAAAQPAGSPPPAVGVVEVSGRPVNESFEFMGRVEAVDRVDVVARVVAYIDEQLFREGAEVKNGDLLYRLERAPFEASLAASQATIAQAEAQLANARADLARARQLRERGTGTEVAEENALAAERTAAAQLQAAQAQARVSEINLGYTEIHAPISGRIGRSAASVGNVVGPNSGTLATIVSQDPMYVTFPVSMRAAVDLRARYALKGGFGAITVKLRLPDDRIYAHEGKLEFVDVSVAQGTDTITLRGTIPNPVLAGSEVGGSRARELTDGQFASVILEAAEPVQQLVVPREAVLSDQRGEFVYVVGADNKAERRTVQLGVSVAADVVVEEGLKEGERVVLEGIQRVRAGMQVAPGPVDKSSQAASSATAR
jgi:membrane fusion protein (multidrug efflux system)